MSPENKDEPEDFLSQGIKMKNELMENFLKFMASMNEEAELRLDGLELKVGKFKIDIKGDVKLKIESEDRE